MHVCESFDSHIACLHAMISRLSCMDAKLRQRCEAEIQQDSAGTASKSINVWKCPPVPQEGEQPAPLTEEHLRPVREWTPHPCVPVCAKFSPTRKLAVTACRAVVMWLPAPDVKPE